VTSDAVGLIEHGPGRAGAATPVARPDPTLPRSALRLCAIACGLAIASITFAQPLLDILADEFAIDRAAAGVIVTVTQIGYALGLALIVPLGDLLSRRHLVLCLSMLAALALLATGTASSGAVLLVAVAGVGAVAVVIQVLVACAAAMAHPSERGSVVGLVTSGVVIGLLLARTLTGVMADLAGWRLVYVTSAVAMLFVGCRLFFVLPKERRRIAATSHMGLVGSLFRLVREERVLRNRGILALLIFGAYTAAVTPLVLPLSAPPHALSHAAIGLFGLSGIAGVFGATFAGRWSDRGGAQNATAFGLVVMLVAWLAVALLPLSIWYMVPGLLALDFGLQSVHVANQGLVYRLRPDAQSRVAAAYMLFYSVGCAAGSMVSTLAFAHAGWSGVCLLGTGINLVALLFWCATRREHCQTRAG
jgi:predicted MFS family arabinose efflux permease